MADEPTRVLTRVGESEMNAFAAEYTCRDVASVLGMTPDQVRGYVRAGLVEPSRGHRGEMRFTFQDVVLLRSARGLAEQIPVRKIRRALRRLRDQLSPGTGLSAVAMRAEGHDVVVRDGESSWEPESGQVRIDFDAVGAAQEGHAPEVLETGPGEPAPRPLRPLATVSQLIPANDRAGQAEAEDWFDRGLELEASGAPGAAEAYATALSLNPEHAGACVNLGRLEHEAGNAARAAELYRRALQEQPADPIGWFNLAVALEDLGEEAEAVHAYARVIELDEGSADAHFNMSRLCEKLGDRAAALRHLRRYRELSR